MPRKTRPLDRDVGTLRDASLIVVASEDTHAVDQYFKRFRTSRIKFLVLPTTDGHSSPDHVTNRVDKFREEYVTEENDQFWVCIDQDHWADSGHIAILNQVCSHCFNRGYRLAISNPSFELWVLLHFDDPPIESIQSGRAVAAKMKTVLGGYNKARCCGHLPFSPDLVRTAIERAEALDTDDSIPRTPLTRVYLILKELIARDSILLN